jgi:hypothetical protein
LTLYSHQLAPDSCESFIRAPIGLAAPIELQGVSYSGTTSEWLMGSQVAEPAPTHHIHLRYSTTYTFIFLSIKYFDRLFALYARAGISSLASLCGDLFLTTTPLQKK